MAYTHRMSVVRELPLAVVSSVKSTLSFAIFFMVFNGGIVLFTLILAAISENLEAGSSLLFYAILAIFYLAACINLSNNIKNRSVSQRWLYAVNIVSLIYVFSLVGIVVAIQLFKNTREVSKLKREGISSFVSDEEWTLRNASSWSPRKSLIISVAAGVIMAAMISFMVVSSSSLNQATPQSAPQADTVTSSS